MRLTKLLSSLFVIVLTEFSLNRFNISVAYARTEF